MPRVFAAAAAAGSSPGRLARDLNTDGVASPTGAGWNRTAVRLILENPAYVGDRYDVKKAHEPVVSRGQWNAADEAPRGRARSATRRAAFTGRAALDN